MSEIEIKTIYNAIPENENMKKYIDLKDIKIKSRNDLVKTCQVFRNPKFETFRIIYMRDNTIVNYESVTSRLPNTCEIFRVRSKNPYLKSIRAFEEITRRMYRLNANGYYLEHNHPSGNAKASFEDIRLTDKISKNIKGFRGHIIIDHGTYAFIEKDMKENKLIVKNNIKIESLPDINSNQMIRENPLLQKNIRCRNDLARLMYDVKHSTHYSSLILTSADSSIRLYQEVPNTFINMNYRQIGGYIKNRCIDTGSTRAFLATTDKPFFERAKELVNLGYASDCLAYTVLNEKATIIDGADKEFVDQDIFKSIEVDDRKRKIEKIYKESSDYIELI